MDRAAIIRELEDLYLFKRLKSDQATTKTQRELNAYYLCALGDAIIAIKNMPDEATRV